MKSASKLMVALLGVALAAAFIAGCNTVHGAGEDLSAGGKAISNAAEKAS